MPLAGWIARYSQALIVLAFLCLWHARATGHLSLRAVSTLGLMVALYMAYGNGFVRFSMRLIGDKGGMPFRFVTGYFVFNTMLFVLALVSPFGMVADVAVLCLAALGVAFACGRFGTGRISSSPAPRAVDGSHGLPALTCLIISLIAATIWCTDAQTSPRTADGVVVFQIWQDLFVHVREISVFSQSHGMATIRDIKMAGAPAQIYHFASYISVAAVAAMADITALEVFSSLQLPFGILLTGLAAFSLMSRLWGQWPAVAATVAVVVLPDAFLQGFGTRYLSYYFMSQVNLGMLYGIACVAIGWIFVIEGCRGGKWLPVAVGYVFWAICATYKAHLFVANSYLMLLYPCLFFAGLKPRFRIGALLLLTTVFIMAAKLSQSIDRVPVLRLDGSGINGYRVQLLQTFQLGFWKNFYTALFAPQDLIRPLSAAYTFVMITVTSFGLWLIAFPVMLFSIRLRGPSTAAPWFAVLIIVNYIVMSLGLAADSRGIGAPEELLNRPMVWAYFIVAAWTAAGLYFRVWGGRAPRTFAARVALSAALCCSLGFPLVFARNLQTLPELPSFKTYRQFNSLPSCLVDAASYIRTHSRPEEVMQDSRNDPSFAVTALAERQLFVGDSTFGGMVPARQRRLQELQRFKERGDLDGLAAYSVQHGIGWYLLRPEDAGSWSAAALDKAVFSCGGYRVLHFGR